MNVGPSLKTPGNTAYELPPSVRCDVGHVYAQWSDPAYKRQRNLIGMNRSLLLKHLGRTDHSQYPLLAMKRA
jgi:hypothetical protein